MQEFSMAEKIREMTDVELINMAQRLVAERSKRVSVNCRKHFEDLGLDDSHFPETLETVVIDAEGIDDLTREQAKLCIVRLKSAIEINRKMILEMDKMDTGEEYDSYVKELRDIAVLWVGVKFRLEDHLRLCGSPS